MAKSDVLINIGNSVPVHMPSKTLEYINTGKPIVNFYKFKDCPTLYYTNRYPICQNVFEGDECTENTIKSLMLLEHGRVDTLYTNYSVKIQQIFVRIPL